MLTRSGPSMCPWPLGSGGQPEGPRSPARAVLSSLAVGGASGAPFLGPVLPAAAFTWPSLPSPFLGTAARGAYEGWAGRPKKLGTGCEGPARLPFLLTVSSVDDGHTAPSLGSLLFLSSWL